MSQKADKRGKTDEKVSKKSRDWKRRRVKQKGVDQERRNHTSSKNVRKSASGLWIDREDLSGLGGTWQLEAL